MDDRHAEFVIAIGQLCAAAELARLPVELVTRDGQVRQGLVAAPRAATGDGQLDSTGLQRTIAIDDALVNLDQIVRCTVCLPAPAGVPD